MYLWFVQTFKAYVNNVPCVSQNNAFQTYFTQMGLTTTNHSPAPNIFGVAAHLRGMRLASTIQKDIVTLRKNSSIKHC